jgi:hypothetical protein
MFLGLTACKKYLDKKPASKLATPTTATDLQALLDQYNNLNRYSPMAGEISADDYYLMQENYEALSEPLRNTYTWEKDHLFEDVASDWYNTWRPVFIANTVLEYAEKLPASPEKNNITGQALCWRAFAMQRAMYIWCLAYDKNSASSDLGLPMRLNTDFNEPSVRSSVKKTYEQVIADFRQAIELLPDKAIHVYRFAKPAAASLLARVFLSMGEYDSCDKYASISLAGKSTTQDFNDTRINQSASFPFSGIKFDNEDILFHNAGSPTLALAVTKARIDSLLYNSYDNDDLRKKIYFRSLGGNTYGFKGSFDGGNSLFTGVTVGETLLMKAETAARKGDTQTAMDYLNMLLEKRYKSGLFQPLSASSAQEALKIILQERRKELVFRGLRWMDIKRLNKEGAGISVTRFINNKIYSLLPNDPRFALPIPEDVIALSGMVQNPR